MKNLEQMEQEFLAAEQKIKRLKTAEITLNKLIQEFPQDHSLFESEIKSIREKLKDLSTVDEVERDVEHVAKDLTEHRRAKDEILDMIARALSGNNETNKEDDRT